MNGVNGQFFNQSAENYGEVDNTQQSQDSKKLQGNALCARGVPYRQEEEGQEGEQRFDALRRLADCAFWNFCNLNGFDWSK